MLFVKHNSVQSFRLSITSSGLNKPVAFGPGSIVNGSVFLALNKQLLARRLRVVFKCEEHLSNKQRSTLFSVENVVWNAKDDVPGLMSSGEHLYLFAIKLPNVNYPPSIHDTSFGHQVEYSLQGFLDLESGAAETKKLQVIYLPLVGCGTEEPPKDQAKQSDIEMTAELVQPAYLPGDMCTVKLTIHNQSNRRLTHIHIALISKSDKRKQHTIHDETFFVSIPKNTRDNHSIFRFPIPSTCLPSNDCVHLSYHVIVSVPAKSSSSSNIWPFSSKLNDNLTVSLPLTVATVPATCGLPQLQIPLQSFSEQQEVPSFIPFVDSPTPSPVSPFSMEGSWLGSPVEPSPLDDTSRMLQDDTGHLMVPSFSDSLSRRVSTSSTLVASDCNIEINVIPSESGSSQVAVQ
ncbi:hypothetical protein EC973_000420 [Apophysomyces ossiformis]|uniref:Arrestin C-terminal-like domain-containing protein n=1 Tax=Apophysomyces ossiformis TaxID=679940 RepID=A0A8H7EN37_9FUNG|nr:hypothetical protein EC973_000420 [Apophysomyces ossiformis]